MTIVGVALMVFGLGCLAASALAWSGRWRSWASRFLTMNVITPLGFLPALGLFALVIGLLLADAAEPSSAAVAIPFVFALALMALDFVGPKWFAPPWLRRERAEYGGIRPDLSDPATALTYGAVAAAEDDAPRSSDTVGRRFRGDPLAQWKAAWVHGKEDGPKPHGLARAGVTEGRLWLYEQGLAFASGRIEDALRGDTSTAVIGREAVRGARTVPPRAGADGEPRPGPAARSMFRRLVVDTDDGSYLFEVMRANSKAKRIEETLG
jgi:F0F1-type ATP synthase membrane subunit c/vacuolar-type H+-ATPase subunit K